jgi:sugar lactone lactonase YvrE
MTEPRITEVLSGTGFLEGPVWRDGRLYVSCVPDRTVLAIDATGRIEEVLVLPAHPTGLAWSPFGDLLIVGLDDRRLRRWDGSEVTEVADLSPLCAGNTNDIVVDRTGRSYISTLARNALATPIEEMDVPSNVLSVEPDGSIVDRGGALRFGNGMAITADGATLLASQTYSGRVSAFDIGDDGGLSNQRDWFVFEDRAEGADGPGVWARRPAPDGIAIDVEDGLWVSDASGSGICRIVEGRGIVDIVSTGDLAVIAATLGGADGRTLYMCAATPLNRTADHGGQQCCVLSCEVAIPGPEAIHAAGTWPKAGRD